MESYGVILKERTKSSIDKILEQLKRNGFSVIDSPFSVDEIKSFDQEFDRVRFSYNQRWQKDEFIEKAKDDLIRLPMAEDSDLFVKLALNSKVIKILKSLFIGKFILNQQNGIYNPSHKRYSQDRWHRDLPYQHFTSSNPIAISAIYCVDEFTNLNGAMHVIPHSHKFIEFPSKDFIEKNAIQIEAKKGAFILFDSMLYHKGGYNKSSLPRRAINHVYNIPFIKQQINIPLNINSSPLTYNEKEILGFGFEEPKTLEDFFKKY
tara:strand:- start:10460 stop:11248 length:789 start_codon:yes stop_codon:yes gene_type:complete